jgi:hypothetical protein
MDWIQKIWIRNINIMRRNNILFLIVVITFVSCHKEIKESIKLNTYSKRKIIKCIRQIDSDYISFGDPLRRVKLFDQDSIAVFLISRGSIHPAESYVIFKYKDYYQLILENINYQILIKYIDDFLFKYNIEGQEATKIRNGIENIFRTNEALMKERKNKANLF